MKHTILFLLLTLSLSAQKSEQVKTYLGEAKYFDKPLKGRVDFVFEKGTLQRRTDGEKTYGEILPDGVGFSDADNAGRLEEIRVNGALISRNTSRSSVTGSARPISFNVPDSVSFLEQTEDNFLGGANVGNDSACMVGGDALLLDCVPSYACRYGCSLVLGKTKCIGRVCRASLQNKQVAYFGCWWHMDCVFDKRVYDHHRHGNGVRWACFLYGIALCACLQKRSMDSS